MPRNVNGERFVIDRSAFLNNTYSAFLHENITLEDRAANKFIEAWKTGPHSQCRPPWSASKTERVDREELMVANSDRPYLASPKYSTGYLRPQFASTHKPSKKGKVLLTKASQNRPATSSARVDYLDVQKSRRDELLHFSNNLAKKEKFRQYVGDEVIRSTLMKLKRHVSDTQ